MNRVSLYRDTAQLRGDLSDWMTEINFYVGLWYGVMQERENPSRNSLSCGYPIVEAKVSWAKIYGIRVSILLNLPDYNFNLPQVQGLTDLKIHKHSPFNEEFVQFINNHIQKESLFQRVELRNTFALCQVRTRCEEAYLPSFNICKLIDNVWTCEECENYKPKSDAGYVYIYGSFQHNLFKIGMSRNPEIRVKALQKMPFQMKMILTIPTPNKSLLEAKLHRKYNHKRLTGEYFNLDANDIKEIQKLQMGGLIELQ